MDIPDPLYRQLKAKAATEGRTVKELILRGAERQLRDRRPTTRRSLRLPVVGSKHPGSVQLDNATIYKIIPFP